MPGNWLLHFEGYYVDPFREFQRPAILKLMEALTSNNKGNKGDLANSLTQAENKGSQYETFQSGAGDNETFHAG